MKFYHESPLQFFESVQNNTDGDYALVHLFEEQPEYLQKFKEAVSKGRNVILDNSIFELGEAFDATRFSYWIDELKPTEYIIPDVLNNGPLTIKNCEEWIKTFNNPGIKIGVAQGSTLEEFIDELLIVLLKLEKKPNE